MNIRCAQFDGVPQNLVHKPDDRCVLCRLVQVRVLVRVLVQELEPAVFTQLPEGIGTDTQPFLHLPLDRFRRGEHRTQIEPGKCF
ncbi:hypothetical protein SDC9_192701 [bioreactor metagenome]|uniref:Uncharacterized protein n=1 Tax=bioreactor metagenome TaxID=1076179 RepID=A0A645I9Y8_9ZZZZ